MVSDGKKIKLTDLKWPDAAAVEKVFARFRQCVDKSQFVLGEEVTSFEKSFAHATGSAFAVGVNSGLDALLLTLRALKIGAGDEVITVANSFVATAAAIALAGARPVFVDVGEDYNLNPALLDEAITPRTKAIIPVHLTGYVCRMAEILAVARKYNIPVIEDAAQAVGATLGGKSAGSFGIAGCFSLHPLKNVHAWGDGGVITTSDSELAGRLALERNHGLISRDEAQFFSYNSRLDTLQAIVASVSLENLERTIAARRAHAALYNEGLKNLSGVTLPSQENGSHVFHLYMVRVARREALMTHLEKAGIETKVHYPLPLHLHQAAQSLGYRRGDLPMTEKLASEILSLPVHENLNVDQIHRVCDEIKRFYS